MRQENIRENFYTRLGRPSTRWGVVIVGGMFFLPRWAMGGPGGLAGAFLPFLIVGIYLTLSPLPWQWTGDDRTRAGMGRGLLQALAFNALWVGALHLCLDALHLPGAPPRGGGAPPPGTPWMAAVMNGLGSTLAGWLIADREGVRLREQSMVAMLRNSQSRALRNQLEPHVLYNALSSLSELVREDPLAAEEVITRLAELYRMLTHHLDEAITVLGRERALVEAYIAMEQMRLGDRLRVTWEWPAWGDALPLPPLFLQPLVENAVKHAISPSEWGGEVVISLRREGGACLLSVVNSGTPLVGRQPEGVGLRNLRERLALWKGADASFTLGSEGLRTRAALRWIPEGAAW